MWISIPQEIFTWEWKNFIFPTHYSIEAKKQVDDILKFGVVDEARNRVFEEAITIDWLESKDLDDAIWAEKTKNGYSVWVHISDVCETIPIYSALDLEAMKRSTSVYRRSWVLNMFPPELSNEVISLNQNGVKNTMSLQIDLDNQAKIVNYNFYESKFKNLSRMDYAGFSQQFVDRDSQFHQTLHTMREISDKLRINRSKSGWIIWYQEEGRRLHLWDKSQNSWESHAEKISHDIIESFMVLANCVTGQHMSENNLDALYKQHLSLWERSFYTPEEWVHEWLQVKNYTHFTSPIRRYADVVIHRILKSILRGEENPFDKEIIKEIANHSNMVRLHIETVWSQIDREQDEKLYIQNLDEKLWAKARVSDMTAHIKSNINKQRKIPDVLRNRIKEIIQNNDKWDWWWIIWVILFSNDTQLKIFLKEHIFSQENINAPKILNLIDSTKILKWWNKIFRILEEKPNENEFKITFFIHNKEIFSYCDNVLNWWNFNQIKWQVRYKVIEKIFNYFIALENPQKVHNQNS